MIVINVKIIRRHLLNDCLIKSRVNRMEPQIVVERDCSALGGLFQIIVNDMKVLTINYYLFL